MLGAIAGAVGMAIVIYATGGMALIASQPLTAAGGVAVGGAFAGQITGTAYNAYKKSELIGILSDEYGITADNIHTFNMEDLPQEVQDLCGKVEEYDDKNALYADIMQRTLIFTTFLMAAQEAYNVGKTVAEYYSQIREQMAAKGEDTRLDIPKASDLKNSQTVQNHINDIVKKGEYKGELSRPYIDTNGTNLLLDEIMGSASPTKDVVLKNGLR